MMNPDTLENILIDRALGALSPDVETLLQEYLATHPDAAATVAEWEATVALTTAVMRHPPSPRALPPCVATAFSPSRTQSVLALAASFVVGAGITMLALHATAPRQAPVLIAQQPAHIVPLAPAKVKLPPEIERRARSLPFWSRERAYLLAGATRDHTRQ